MEAWQGVPKLSSDARRAREIRRVGRSQSVEADRPDLARSAIRANILVTLSGWIGSPSIRANTSEDGSRPTPSAGRSAACFTRYAFNSSTSEGDRAILRRLRFVFGVLNRRPDLVYSSDCTTVNVRLSRSTSDQRKPRTSPRRGPVARGGRLLGASGLREPRSAAQHSRQAQGPRSRGVGQLAG
jgi:hypothetical protein